MKILRLELFGYKRLMLGNIQRLVLTPESAYQLILGTNGSGKSSVLFELSPLPGQSSNYSKEGYKDILISHRGCEYRLVSTFKNGKHSFLKDGEEFNPGGTGQVQKELVRREFNYTQELHEVLIGDVRFTTMSPSDRRKWITALSTADYSYALRVYKKWASSARDQQGALKHIKQRLTQESNNLKALSELEGLEHKSHILRDELTMLLSARTPGLPSYPDLSGQVDQQLLKIEQLARQTLHLMQPMPRGQAFRSTQDVDAEMHRVNGEVSATQTYLDRLTTEYSDMEAVVQSIGGGNEVNADNVDLHITEIDTEIAELEPKIQVFRNLRDADYLRQDTFQIIDGLVGLFSQLPDNQDRRFSPESARLSREKIAAHEKTVDMATVRLRQISERLATIRSAKDTECPNCGYVWREGVSEQEIEQLEQWQSQHEKVAETAQQAIREEQAFLEEVEAYHGLITRFKGLVNGYPRLKPLWDYLLDNNLVWANPKGQLGVFVTWQQDVEVAAQLEKLRQKREQLLELSMRQSQLGGALHFNQRLVKLNEDIAITTKALQRLRLNAKDIRQYRERLERIADVTNQLDQSVQTLQTLRDKTIDALRNQHIDQVAYTHQTDLAQIQRQLTEKRALEGIVNDLAVSHDEVELDHQAFALMAQALSPTEGLIAEQLMGFINCLVAQFNAIISAIWTYDLFVLPCEMESGELDYKFPLQVRSTDSTVGDVNKGSKAQQQIIDFAFQLTAMLYMEMTDWPLYLDEPGEGFDEQHRMNLMNFVKQLMDANQHSQLFMISHYAATHGSLLSAQVLVLDSANIAVPGEFNQHVVMS